MKALALVLVFGAYSLVNDVSNETLRTMGASLLFDWVHQLDDWILQVFPFRLTL